MLTVGSAGSSAYRGETAAPPLENLLGDNQAPAVLDTGEPISPAQARQLACEAGIIPMVLGGKSKILDLGRKKLP